MEHGGPLTDPGGEAPDIGWPRLGGENSGIIPAYNWIMLLLLRIPGQTNESPLPRPTPLSGPFPPLSAPSQTPAPSPSPLFLTPRACPGLR